MSIDSRNFLKDSVTVSPFYQRSVRISDDLGNSSLSEDYVVTDTAVNTLSNMASQVVDGGQRAFTWTGPYGTGKSSLALALARLLKSQDLREGNDLIYDVDLFNKAFPFKNKGWLVLPIIGGEHTLFEAISSELLSRTGVSVVNQSELVSSLANISSNQGYDGTLLVIDELGRFLESSQTDNSFLLQELAETFARNKAPTVVIGILHQTFKQYAKKLGLSKEQQNEWEKIQGRFADIPLVSPSEEVVDLIGKAIVTNELPPIDSQIIDSIFNTLQSKKPAISTDLKRKLANCWPLHPLSALLMGTASRKQFGQNERSIFSFLGSQEPGGFQEYLKHELVTTELTGYKPSDFWDYLKLNLEGSILSSSDSYKWSVSVDAIDRAQSKGSALHLELLKTISVIELFKSGTGIEADLDCLLSLYPGKGAEIQKALFELESWNLLIFRKFNEAWALYEGSDFNIEEALDEEFRKTDKLSSESITEIVPFPKVVAKRHLYETGTLRWLDVIICPCWELTSKAHFKPSSGHFGRLVLLVGKEKEIEETISAFDFSNNKSIILGSSKDSEKLLDLTRTLVALLKVSESAQLDGDSVARKEVFLRISEVRNQIETTFAHEIESAKWSHVDNPNGETVSSSSALSSKLADIIFRHTPTLISELVNRDKLSASSTKARKDLLYRMLKNSSQMNLGIDGYPAEKGLYLTCLQQTGLHGKSDNDDWRFTRPNDSLQKAWEAAEKLIEGCSSSISGKDIAELWSSPPYGIKQGIIPILLWALILSKTESIALYREGYYVPEPESIDIDLSLQSFGAIELRNVAITDSRKKILGAVNNALFKAGLSTSTDLDPLSSARRLVAFIFKLPEWTKKTRALSKDSILLRNSLLKASDPHVVVFHQLPEIFGETPEQLEAYLAQSLTELDQASNAMLDSLRGILFSELKASSDESGSINIVRDRATRIKGTTGDLTVNAFVGRISELTSDLESMVGIGTLLSQERFDDWNDQTVKDIKNKLAEYANEFRKLEVTAKVHGTESYRDSIAFASSSRGEVYYKEFDVSQSDKESVSKLVSNIEELFNENRLKDDFKLATLVQLLQRMEGQEKR